CAAWDDSLSGNIF
nr:immunoglobulin light chain junction region [Macaca mulatta]MPO03157.1 immunoglobulin light chain junction region [Macaca mulatta]MPO03161.1 immunoglobulin light chain junction region [Macaca mulatta]MPO03343.1 immunoglobulin light chain junction region [Macaca mulatta]MPO03416.1 immunoglobulin light chain junction region [Macaca mulatta]